MHRWLALALLLTSCARTATRARASAFVWFEPRAGCVGPTGHTLPPWRASDTLSATFARTRIDAARAFAARRLPGGYANGPVPTASPAGRAIIWLKDSTARDAVLEQLTAMPGLEPYPQFPRDSVDVRLVDWDGAALYDWMHYIVKQGSPTPGVNGWGIDLRHRISLGVASEDAVPALRAHLERLGVPCGLVIIWNMGPVSLASRSGLRDNKFKPAPPAARQ